VLRYERNANMADVCAPLYVLLNGKLVI